MALNLKLSLAEKGMSGCGGGISKDLPEVLGSIEADVKSCNLHFNTVIVQLCYMSLVRKIESRCGALRHIAVQRVALRKFVFTAY